MEDEDLKTQIETLTAENAEFRERLAKLEAKGRPSAPIKWTPGPIRDLTAGMSVSRETLQVMVDAVPTAVTQGIVKELRIRAELKPLGRGYTTPPLPRSRHLNPAPLEVPGVELADRLMADADARERAEKIVADPSALAKWKAGRK